VTFKMIRALYHKSIWSNSSRPYTLKSKTNPYFALNHSFSLSPISPSINIRPFVFPHRCSPPVFSRCNSSPINKICTKSMTSSNFNAMLRGCGVQHLTKHAGVYFKERTHMRPSVTNNFCIVLWIRGCFMDRVWRVSLLRLLIAS
jgi:hypothetical protein